MEFIKKTQLQRPFTVNFKLLQLCQGEVQIGPFWEVNVNFVTVATSF